MKYIAKFENISMSKNRVDEIEIEQNVEKYLSGLSDYDINKLKIDLEILAKKHNLNFDDLQDPEIVKQILTNTNESFKSWLADNWYYLVDKISKYGNIFAAVTFVGTMLSHYLTGNESLTGVKVAVVAYTISSLVGLLKKLKEE
jgi:hypothetical protein